MFNFIHQIISCCFPIGRLFIILNTHDAIKEAFVERGSDFAGRPVFGAGVKTLQFNDGIIDFCI